MSNSNDVYVEIIIPKVFSIFDFNNPIEINVTSRYLDSIINYKYLNYLQSSEILVSTIKVVNDINDYITKIISDNLWLSH